MAFKAVPLTSGLLFPSYPCLIDSSLISISTNYNSASSFTMSTLFKNAFVIVEFWDKCENARKGKDWAFFVYILVGYPKLQNPWGAKRPCQTYLLQNETDRELFHVFCHLFFQPLNVSANNLEESRRNLEENVNKLEHYLEDL